jgi:hypothetical protein
MFHTYRNMQPDYLCGWRYVFSRSYREKVHEKWGENTITRVMCIIGGIAGMILTSSLAIVLLLYFAGYL